MRYIVEKKLNVNNHYVIDYANLLFSNFRNIFLSAKRKLFTGSENDLICILGFLIYWLLIRTDFLLLLMAQEGMSRITSGPKSFTQKLEKIS